MNALVTVAALVLLPTLARAQGTLTGTVRDVSGAVLPGVTVEASSDALIEKVRTVVTDGTGQYRIIDLRPGTYALAFTLPGFTTVRREGVELAGSQTLTIPIEMRVGQLQETITVTGETPVVDLQSVKRELVLDSDVIQAIPATRAVGSLLNATPGLTVDNNGMAASPTMTFFSARGGQANEGRMTINNMIVAAAFNGGGVSSYIYDSPNSDEVSVAVSGGLGEADIGGPVMNLVPRTGGNTFRGQAFFNTAGDWSRGNNLTDELMAPPPGPNLRETPGIIKSYDASVSYGGPIVRDRLWFFGSYRKLETHTAVEGVRANANVYDASRWDWVESPVTARFAQGRQMYIGRLTAQLTERNRVSFNYEYQHRCEGTPLKLETTGACRSRSEDWIGLGTTTQSPEATTTAARGYFDFPYHVTQGMWTAPLTNKLLAEAGYTSFIYWPAFGQAPPDGIMDLIPVSEQSTAMNPATGLQYAPAANYAYRGLLSTGRNYGNPNNWRGSLSYVTGAHNMKVGYQGAYFITKDHLVTNDSLMSYRFNQGVANRVTYRLPEWEAANRVRSNSLYIQDTWTRGRLTLQGALRYDRASSFSPAEGNGTQETSPFNPAPITFDRVEGVNAYNDITPRVGVAYDVFGNGKTAIKFNWGHYLDAATNDSIYTAMNPANRIVQSVDRDWTDTNGNKQVDCNLLDPALQTAVDRCAALTGNALNFGKTGSGLTQVNPALLYGWGVRENDYQWGINVQQELVPRVSLDVGYNRRWFKGATVTDNQTRSPDEWDSWTIDAPLDERLPEGGGYPITMYTVKAANATEVPQNYVTFEKEFGPERTNYWHGVDVTVNARLQNGLMVQVGTQTGRGVFDACAATTKMDTPDPRTSLPGFFGVGSNCKDIDPVETTFRGLASYTIPKIDVLVSATFRSQPKQQLTATWPVPNAIVQQRLGRLPVGANPLGNTNVALLDNEHRVYDEDRRAQIDMRFAKIFRFGGTRTDVGVDIGNLLNTNYGTAFEGTYQYSLGNTQMGGTWANPTAIYTPRYFRLNFTVDF
jgi:hypothetical protein